MLKNLYVENIALISKLNVEFNEGLSVLSGETGAGKSIIVDALAFVLGNRADKSLIKSGEEKALVETVFSVESNDRARQILEELGFDVSDECILARSMTQSGKNEIRINGRVSTLAVLKQITGVLVDIFGQNEQTYLLKSENHINILDGFECDDVTLADAASAYSSLKEIDRELKKFGGNDYERERSLSMLQFQIEEIENAALFVGEEDELNTLRKKAMNAEKVSTALKIAADNLGDSEYSAAATVSAALNVLNAVSDVDVQYFELCGRLEGCKIEIQDIYHSISDALNAFDFDASDVDRVETRLDKIRGLKRKYGGSVEKTLEFLEKSRQVYDELINADETIATLKLTREKILARLFAVCKKLTVQRKLAALKFEKEIVTELNELGMSGATFQVQFNEGSGKDITEQFITSKGWDEVEFLFSANKGEPAKPLAKIASGGEMSRFMLAVKNITARIEKIPTMIFDEIDAGISGQMASVVAQKLAKISRDYQAVVITHLPQIACMGDNNYLVEKYVDDGRTKTVLTHLDEDGKIREVQRLIGGKDVGQFGGLHAKDMATWADKYKLSLRK